MQAVLLLFFGIDSVRLDATGTDHVEGEHSTKNRMIQSLTFPQRCQKLEKQCVFFEIPKDPVSEYDELFYPIYSYENIH